MANCKQHLCIGVAAGALTYIVMTHRCDRQFDAAELFGCTVVSALAALVPDVLAPALTPNHRGLAHSIATGSALARIAHAHCDHREVQSSDFEKIVFVCAFAGYVSHLVADGLTPRSLPLLC